MAQLLRRALVVEDQITMRDLLGELLEGSLGWKVEVCGTVAEARGRLSRGHFDLVILDLVLPDASGTDLLAELRRRRPAPRVIVLTAHSRPAVIRSALAGGANAILTKGAPLRELREAIDRVGTGGVYYSAETSRLLHEAASTPARDEQLTPRQREILRGVASGLSTKEIAAQLSLSEKTVSNHRQRIMERIGIRDVAGLTRYAVSLGLIDPSP